MPAAPSSSVLVLSIDVDARVGAFDHQGRRDVEAAAATLAACVSELKLAATWAFTDLADGRLAKQLLTIPRQQLGILGAGDWTGPAVARQRVAMALARHRQQFEAIGCLPASLVLERSAPTEQLDLLVKQGITAVRPAVEAPAVAGKGWLTVLSRWMSSRRTRPNAAPRALRWGVWEMGVSLMLPEAGVRHARRTIDLAIAAGRIEHLVVDVADCVYATGSRSGGVERILKHLAQRRDAGLVESLNMAELAARLTFSRESHPARSILRRAA
jgi:hypothetical protein